MKTKALIIITCFLLLFISACSPVPSTGPGDSVQPTQEGMFTATLLPTQVPTNTATPLPPTVTPLPPTPTATPLPPTIGINTIPLLQVAKVIKVHPAGQVLDLGFSSDGTHIITGSSELSVRITDLASGTIQSVYYLSRINASRATFSTDGKFILSGHADGDVWKLNNLSDENLLNTFLSMPPQTVVDGVVEDNTVLSNGSLTFAADMKPIALPMDPEGISDFSRLVREVKFIGMRFDAQNMDLWKTALASENFPEAWREFADTPLETPLWLWHLSYNNELPAAFAGERTATGNSIYLLDVSPANDRFAYNLPNGDVSVVSLSDLTQSIAIPANKEGICSLVYSPSGSVLATGGCSSLVQIWNAKDGSMLQELSGHSNAITEVAFSPDGSLLASSGWDGNIFLWDTSTWESTYKLRQSEVNDLSFSEDGSLLFSGGQSLKIWDTSTGKMIKEITVPSKILNLALSPAGDLLAVGGIDGNVTLFGLVSAMELIPIMPGQLSKELIGADYQFIINSTSEEIVAYYQREMSTLGWKLQQDLMDSIPADLVFTKSGITLAFMISPEGENNVVTIQIVPPTSITSPITTNEAPAMLIRLGPGKFGGPLFLEVLEGDYKLTSGATLQAGSSVDVFEEWMIFSSGLAIDVEGGEITLKGTTYASGTKLIVDSQGNLILR